MIVDKINQYLSSQGADVPEPLAAGFMADCRDSFTRQFGPAPERDVNIRLSSIGRCLRQQAYKVKGYETLGKEIDSRAKMVFMMGDLTEATLMHVAMMAGCHITDQQKEVDIMGVKGHIDGLYEGKLVEVKSMSSFSFKRFEQGEIGEPYIYQLNAYLYALGLEECIYLALNKDAGVIGERVFRIDEQVVDSIKKRIEALQNLNGRMPARPYKPDNKGFLPWQCLYCAYHGHCWPDATQVLVGRAYKLKHPRIDND